MSGGSASDARDTVGAAGIGIDTGATWGKIKVEMAPTEAVQQLRQAAAPDWLSGQQWQDVESSGMGIESAHGIPEVGSLPAEIAATTGVDRSTCPATSEKIRVRTRRRFTR